MLRTWGRGADQLQQLQLSLEFSFSLRRSLGPASSQNIKMSNHDNTGQTRSRSEFSVQGPRQSPDDQARRLSDLAQQLARIADALLKLAGASSDEVVTSRLEPNPSVPRIGKRRDKADQARAIYQVRRSRSAIFEHPEIFGEPAWDILLDLYIATAEGKDISVSSACIGSAVPPTTGLRWLGILADKGLVLRRHDPIDQRRVLVHLTREGLALMDKFFETAEAQSQEH
jgi:hypothetical protein